MADLHRYAVRIQQWRTISIDALNAQHAKVLGEQDSLDVGDAELAQATQATLTATNVGDDNGQTLDRFDVRVRFRRNIVIDAQDKAEARLEAELDTNIYPGTDSVQIQSVTFLREKTGST